MFPSTQSAALNTPILPSCPLHLTTVFISPECALPSLLISPQFSLIILSLGSTYCNSSMSDADLPPFPGRLPGTMPFNSRKVTISITQMPESPLARAPLVFLRCHSFPHLLLLPQPLLHLSPKYDSLSSDLEGF